MGSFNGGRGQSVAGVVKHDRRRMLALLAGLCLLPASLARADDDDDDHHEDRSGKGRGRGHGRKDDHEYAADAVRSGDIRPLREILAKIGRTHPGDVVGVELELEDGVPVYEIKLLRQDGRYVEIYVDARDARIIKAEGE
mgnify:CR=1 FL=1